MTTIKTKLRVHKWYLAIQTHIQISIICASNQNGKVYAFCENFICTLNVKRKTNSWEVCQVIVLFTNSLLGYVHAICVSYFILWSWTSMWASYDEHGLSSSLTCYITSINSIYVPKFPSLDKKRIIIAGDTITSSIQNTCVQPAFFWLE